MVAGTKFLGRTSRTSRLDESVRQANQSDRRISWLDESVGQADPSDGRMAITVLSVADGMAEVEIELGEWMLGGAQ